MDRIKQILTAIVILAVGVVTGLVVVERAHGQSTPGFVYGQVPTAAQWNSYFAAKQDVLGFPPVNKNGDTMLGQLVVQSSSTSGAGLNLIPGVAPTSPNNGDIWVTSSGVFAQVNGSTVGPFGSSNLTSAVTVNLSSSPLITAQSGTIFQGMQSGGTVARMELDSFGSIASFSGVVAGGTPAAPTAVTSGAQLTGINAFAYDGTQYDGPLVSFRTYAAENIASGHFGSKACIATTPVASTTLADSLCQQASGGITVGAPTGGDQGAGTINVSSGFLVNGAAIGLSAIAANSVLANLTGSSAVPVANAINGGASCGDATHALKYTTGSPGTFGCQAITASATAGGSNTQVQYNNATAIGGISGVTSDGTAMTFADGDLKLSGGTSGTAILKAPATGGGTFTLPVTASDTISTIAATQTLTNKTIDTASNTFKIAGTSITAITGNTGTVATTTGSFTTNHCVQADANDNLVDSGGTCGGSGTPAGVSGNLQFNNAGNLGALSNSNVSGALLELGAIITPTNTLTFGSTGTGIKLFNTVAQVTNTEDAFLSWSSNIFTIGTENAGTGQARQFNITSASVLALASGATSNIQFKTGGTIQALMDNTGTLKGNIVNGPSVSFATVPTGIIPVIVPNRQSTNTGIGAQAVGNLSLIAGGTEIARISATGLLVTKDIFTSAGSTPGVSCNSGSPSVTSGSTDTAGEVTEGTGATSCTVTWTASKAQSPFCVVTYENAVLSQTVATGTTGMTTTHSAAGTKSFMYVCVQHS